MAFNKLTSLLQAFGKPLLKKFNTYLHSPFFNIPPAAVALYTYLEKLHPQFDEKKLQPGIIAKKIPELFNDNKQAKAGTALLKALEHFIAVEHWQLNPVEHTLHLLEGFKRLKLYENFETTAAKFSELLEQCPEKDIDYFWYRHLLAEAEHTGFMARLQRNPKNTIQPITQTLDEFYAIKKLRYHCELLSRHQILGTPYDKEDIDELLQILEPFNNPQYPYVYLFANIYRLMRAPVFEQGEFYYQLLYRFIADKNYTTLPQGVKEAVAYLINYCLHWNNRGYQEAGTYALYWYELKKNHRLLIENGLFQPSDFRNIVSLAIINRKAEKWLRQFIDDYAPYLPAEHAPTNVAFAEAQYFYYTKQFEKAMPLFQQAQGKDEPIFNMIVKRWQFMCMYEQSTGSPQVLLDFLIAWERQLQRTAPALHQLKEVFAKVISYSKKLLAANTKKLKAEAIAALEQEPFFAGKHWLLEQFKK